MSDLSPQREAFARASVDTRIGCEERPEPYRYNSEADFVLVTPFGPLVHRVTGRAMQAKHIDGANDWPYLLKLWTEDEKAIRALAPPGALDGVNE